MLRRTSPFLSKTLRSVPLAGMSTLGHQPSGSICQPSSMKMLPATSWSAETTPAVYTQTRAFSTTSMLAARGAGRSSKDVSASQSAWSTTTFTGTTEGSAADSLTPHVRKHLIRVYNLLGVGVGAAAIGSSLMMLTPLGRAVPYWLPMIGSFVPLFWLMWAPPANPQLKVGLFLSFALLEGMALSPIVYASAAKGVLGSALVMTAAVFGGFSAAAYLSPRASLIRFQGPLMGILMGMFAVSLLNIFYPTAFAHSLILYGGLALFSALIAVDTQAMIERARCGVGDHVQDAMQMFINVINIFVRISAILRGD